MTQAEIRAGSTQNVMQNYYFTLEQALHSHEFYRRMRMMVESAPYFFPPYVEIINSLEADGLREERTALLQFAKRRIAEMLHSQSLRAEAGKMWTKKDGAAMLALLRESRTASTSIIRDGYLELRAQVLYAKLRESTPTVPKNLVLVEHVDVSSILAEIREHEICWLSNTKRQEIVSYHQDTNAIVLRDIPKENLKEHFTPIDGPHESMRTPLADIFPESMRFFDRFQKKRGGGYGRVVFVRLKPHSLVYRHYDSEPWLRERNRYHLVIQSAEGSYMTSGTETATFQDGDLFLFNNMVMHTAENRSSEWRIHAIFDMKES